MTETNILRRIRIAASKLGARLFRNNVGVAIYPDGRRVRYGLAPGSSDLIGWTPITVTPEHVGQTLAVFTAVEVKGPRGQVAAKQQNFVGQVNAAGGLGIIAYSAEDVEAAVGSTRGNAVTGPVGPANAREKGRRVLHGALPRPRR